MMESIIWLLSMNTNIPSAAGTLYPVLLVLSMNTNIPSAAGTF